MVNNFILGKLKTAATHHFSFCRQEKESRIPKKASIPPEIFSKVKTALP
jgi:hypothetical protein